jgi:hypothetical protein
LILLNNANDVQLTNGVLPVGLSEVTVEMTDLLLAGMKDTDEFLDMLHTHTPFGDIENKKGGFVLRLRETIGAGVEEDTMAYNATIWGKW